ncbi:MAG: hypothetical protein AB7F86_00940 [Bdellovibrionales bacterium]
MADPLSNLKEKICRFCATDQSKWEIQFGSRTEGYRQRVRDSISSSLTGLESDDLANLVQLEKVPVVRGWSLSITHCPSVGGWVAVPGSQPIGLDIEIQNRLTSNIVNRIASVKELANCPLSIYLFPAKEAVFKSLYGPRQPQIITQIEVNAWRSCPDGWGHEFEVVGHPDLRGLSFLHEEWVVSLCTGRPVSE